MPSRITSRPRTYWADASLWIGLAAALTWIAHPLTPFVFGVVALAASVVAERQIAATPGLLGAKEARLGRYAGIGAIAVCLLAHALLLALDGSLYGVRVFG